MIKADRILCAGKHITEWFDKIFVYPICRTDNFFQELLDLWGLEMPESVNQMAPLAEGSGVLLGDCNISSCFILILINIQ